MSEKSFLSIVLIILANSLAAPTKALADATFDYQRLAVEEKPAVQHEDLGAQRLSTIAAADAVRKHLPAQDIKSLVNLGRINRRADKYKISIKYYKQALTLARRERSLRMEDVADVYNQMAESYIGLGKLSQAQKTLKEAVGRLNKNRSKDCTINLEITNLAMFYENTGQYTASEPIYRTWLTNEERKYGPNHRYLLSPLERLSSNLARQGRFKEAEKVCSRAVELCSKSTFKDTLMDVDVLDICANVYTESGNYETAERMYKQAISIIEKSGEAQGISDLITHYSKVAGELDWRIENKNNCTHNFDRITEWTFHPETRILNDLAILYQKQRKYKQAQLTYELALRCATEQDRTQIETRARETAKIQNNLASVLADQGDFLNAEKLYLNSLAVKEKCWPANFSYVLNGQINYLNLLLDTDRFAEARKLRMLVRRNDTYKCLTKNI